MIPLAYLFLAWLIFVAIFVLFAILTVTVHMRFGVSGSFTTVTGVIFLIVGILVILVSGIYFTQVDWSQNIGLFNLNTFGTQQSTSQFNL